MYTSQSVNFDLISLLYFEILPLQFKSLACFNSSLQSTIISTYLHVNSNFELSLRRFQSLTIISRYAEKLVSAV